MFPTGVFNQAPLAFPFPGNQTPSLYQSQYGGVAGFNPQLVSPYPQIPAPRGQSLPAPGRQFSTPTGPYISQQPPPPTQPSSSSRRQPNPYPPPAPSQHYEYRHSHGSRSTFYLF